jgi:hypothetical protein
MYGRSIQLFKIMDRKSIFSWDRVKQAKVGWQDLAGSWNDIP